MVPVDDVKSPYRRGEGYPSTPRLLRREIERTAARGPRPEEMAIFKRQAAAAKKRAEVESAYAAVEES